jgi:uncharacterized membrane protein
MTWAAFWLAVFVVSFASFSGLSALIALKGVGEIRELFHELEIARARREKEK